MPKTPLQVPPFHTSLPKIDSTVQQINRLFFTDVSFTTDMECGLQTALRTFGVLEVFKGLHETNNDWSEDEQEG